MRLTDLLDELLASARKPTVLELDLARGLLEVRPTNPLQALQSLHATSMTTLRTHLRQAAQDPRVAGLIVHAVHPKQPMPVLDEVGQEIESFGEQKPTVAWAESFGEMGNNLAAYQLATAARQVWLQPTGDVGIGGLELTITLLKGLLNKAGLEPQFAQRKEYKSAADQFAADEVTAANREMMTRLGQSLVDESVATIARRRGITQERVWEAVNTSPISADQALRLGLVDRLGYRDEVYEACLAEWGLKSEHLRFVQRWTPQPNLQHSLRPPRDKVAVVSLRGGIVTGRGAAGPGGQQAGSDVIDEHLRACLRDDAIKAVVLEVESGGGSAVASDFIRRAVLRVKNSGRPVVARMGRVAASGGYYSAMGANEIVAQPSTLTGSIGVVAGKFVSRGLFEKLEVKREPIRIGTRAGLLSGASEFSPEDWEKLDEILDRVYDDFTRFAAADRGMELAELEQLARGRVWTGADAKRHGLIDHLGGWQVAYQRACTLAGLDPDRARVVHVGRLGPLDKLLPANSSESRSSAASLSSTTGEELLVRAAAWLGVPIHGALSLPFQIEIR